MEIIKRDNNEVAKDDVESTASQLQGGRLVGEVDEAARPFMVQASQGNKKISVG